MHFGSSFQFFACLTAINLMGGVRYLLRIGEPHTSPGYSPIPVAYFYFYDLLVASLLIVLVRKTIHLSLTGLVVYLGIVLFLGINWLQADSFFVLGAARSVALSGFVFLCVYSQSNWIMMQDASRTVALLAGAGFFFLCYQVMEYYLHGVLPAHSTPGHLVRFGSFYDDSLVLGLVLPMFGGYFFARYKGALATLVTAMVVSVMAVMTGSMTAMAIALLYITCKLVQSATAFVVFSVGVVAALIFGIGQLEALWKFKGDSIAGHLDGWAHFGSIDLLAVAGIRPMDVFAEPGFVFIMCNFGAGVVIALVLIHILTLFACYIVLSHPSAALEERALAGAVQGLTWSAFLGSLNLPVVIISPVYLLLAALSPLVIRASEAMGRNPLGAKPLAR